MPAKVRKGDRGVKNQAARDLLQPDSEDELCAAYRCERLATKSARMNDTADAAIQKTIAESKL